MSDDEDSYNDLISTLNGATQYAFGYVVALFGFILLSPLLLLKRITLVRIGNWFGLISNALFRTLPVVFLPFFIMHEILHILFMSVALLHPRIKFLGWMKPTFHTAETFSAGMRIQVPDEDERTVTVNTLALLICIAPVLGFIPTAWAAGQTTNPYVLVYLLLGVLWCIPSTGDRMVIRDTVDLLRHRKTMAQQPSPRDSSKAADGLTGTHDS